MEKTLFSITAVIFFAFIAGFALLHNGLPPTHDGEYHVIRFYEFDKALRGGDLYPRWAYDLNNGFGVPLFNYVYPLPNYFSSLLHFLGLSFIDAFKFSMFFATIIGAISIYFWVKLLYGNKSGIVSSAFYSFAPYRLVDIYVRGSVGELWALAFFPASLFFITLCIKNNKGIFAIFSSIFLALTIFSHNILSLMFLPFFLTYSLFLIRQKKEKIKLLLKIIFTILVSILLTAIFWIPALFETKFVKGLQIYDIKNNFPEFYQLLIPSWGTGFSGSHGNEMSFQIGLANIFVVIVSMLFIIFIWKKNKSKRDNLLFFLICFFVVFCLMQKISIFVWEFLPFMNYFQFPWRFLSVIILITSFLSGIISSIINKNILYIILTVLPILFGIGYVKPAYYLNREDRYYTTRSNFIDGTNSPGNLFNTIWFNNKLKREKDKVYAKKVQVKNIIEKGNSLSFTVNSKTDSKIIVNKAYFPGWTYKINNKEERVDKDSNGRIVLFVPKGESSVFLKFKDTQVRIAATILSLITFFILIIYFIYSYRAIIKK